MMSSLTGRISNVSLNCDGIRFKLVSRENDEEQTELLIKDCSDLDILQISMESGFVVTCYVNDNSECLDFHI